MRQYILAVVSTALALSALSKPAVGASPASQTWIERPWEIRYILFAEEAGTREARIRIARKINAEHEAPGKETVYLSGTALLKPTATLAVPGAAPIGVVLLTFDRVGRITNQQGVLSKMSAKRNLLDDLVLTSHGSPEPRPYYLADWAQGIPGDITFSPSVCSSEDRFRYQDDRSVNDLSGNFGCREWTAQLYDRDQPYIDVTSYAPRGSFIGELVGWSRFEDPPKPVIGRQGKTWLCLHECPAGEQPGVIPDIKKWTARHGFPMPQRPRKQPLYPDADYHDDLNE